MKKLACGAALLTCLAAACGSDATPTTPSSTTTPTTQTKVFAGSLEVGASSFYSFTPSQAGTVSVTLASLTVGTGTGVTSNVVMGLGVGVPAGTDCSLTTSVDTAAALVAQMSNAMSPGTYCVRIYDIGNLTEPVRFAIRIVHPS